MDVIYSTQHLPDGRMKDAQYLAKSIIPIMSKVNFTKELFDLVAFDGAANDQKSGNIIQQRFPK